MHCSDVDLEEQSKNRLEKIETAMPIAQNFQDSCGQLLEWLDKVQPAIESTRADLNTDTQVGRSTEFLNFYRISVTKCIPIP